LTNLESSLSTSGPGLFSSGQDSVLVALPAPVVDGQAGSLAKVMQRERIYRRLLASSDAVSALLAVVVSARLMGWSIRWPILFVPIVAVLVAKIQGLYDRDDMVISKSTLAEWRPIVQAASVTAIGAYLLWAQLTNAPSSDGMRLFVVLVASELMLGVPGRTLARALARRYAPAERCLIVGRSASCATIAQGISTLKGVELVGSVPASELHRPLAELRALVKSRDVHRLVIVPESDSSDDATLQLVRGAKWIGLRVSLFPTLLAAVGGCTVFDEVDGLTLLGVPRFGLSRSSRAVKRALDLIASSIAIAIASPALLLIAVLVRLDSPGPALFRQTRVGQNGEHFEMLKIRTMVVGADDMKAELMDHNEVQGGLFKMANDPRVTRLGAHLRSSHLDELPQLFNVLRGQMSLVGPRPLVPEEDELLAGGDRYRLHLTPGMTGPWQIKGPMSTPLAEMAKLDYLYISNWSLWQDIDILLKTAVRVVRRSGH
jgi:exopolysaccharide biosynthesis polyprenyl glycosylphosphotransferase